MPVRPTPYEIRIARTEPLQIYPDNVITAVLFDAVYFDPQNLFDTRTRNIRVPEDGLYEILGYIEPDDEENTIGLFIRADRTVLNSAQRGPRPTPETKIIPRIFCRGVHHLKAGQMVNMIVQQSGAEPINVHVDNRRPNLFMQYIAEK